MSDRCTRCHGAGCVEHHERRPDGTRTYYDRCPMCDGRGDAPDENPVTGQVEMDAHVERCLCMLPEWDQ
jgi:DnaJ-class molecular chaperone